MATDSTDAPFTAAGRQALRRLLAKPGGGDLTRSPVAVALVAAFLAPVGWIALETHANREAIHRNGVAIAVSQTNLAAMDARLEKVEASVERLETSVARLEAGQAELHRKIDSILAQQTR